MKVKVFYPDRNGNIVLSKEELEKLLDEVYNEGLSDGSKRYTSTPWTYPSFGNGTITYTKNTISTNPTNDCTTTYSSKYSSNAITYTTTAEA